MNGGEMGGGTGLRGTKKKARACFVAQKCWGAGPFWGPFFVPDGGKRRKKTSPPPSTNGRAHPPRPRGKSSRNGGISKKTVRFLQTQNYFLARLHPRFGAPGAWGKKKNVGPWGFGPGAGKTTRGGGRPTQPKQTGGGLGADGPRSAPPEIFFFQGGLFSAAGRKGLRDPMLSRAGVPGGPGFIFFFFSGWGPATPVFFRGRFFAFWPRGGEHGGRVFRGLWVFSEKTGGWGGW